MSSWEETTLDKISRPSTTTAAAVSSHEDSIPRMRVGMFGVSEVKLNFSTGGVRHTSRAALKLRLCHSERSEESLFDRSVGKNLGEILRFASARAFGASAQNDKHCIF